MPQVEVTFDIDANGILNVSAKDKATGKEQKIVIKASSGLSEDEIKRMVSDAEAHAAEDKKFRELVESRNHADGLVHATEKSLQELGDKVGGEDRAKIESAMSDLRTAMKGDDKEQIDRKAKALTQAASSLAQVGGSGCRSGRGSDRWRAGAGGAEQASGKDDVVDAEFEEVKDKEDR